MIVIASDDKPEVRARALSAGAAAYLLTPVDKHANPMTKTHLLVAVVDDDRSIRLAWERLVRFHGMDVEIYASGEEFLKAAEIRQFDCVLLDLHLPTRNGHEVLSRLTQLATRIPVIVIASDDKPEARARALSAGAAAYLLTPVDKHALLNAIATATLVQQSA